MLKVTNSKTFYGTSVINDVIVANMTATVSENGSLNINKSVMNQSVYIDNKEQVEKDMSDFDELVYSSLNCDSENA